jgi:hypothetical protein
MLRLVAVPFFLGRVQLTSFYILNSVPFRNCTVRTILCRVQCSKLVCIEAKYFTVNTFQNFQLLKERPRKRERERERERVHQRECLPLGREQGEDMVILESRVADPHPFNTDPDPFFHFIADLDLESAPHQSDANLRPLVYRPSRASF